LQIRTSTSHMSDLQVVVGVILSRKEAALYYFEIR